MTTEDIMLAYLNGHLTLLEALQTAADYHPEEPR